MKIYLPFDITILRGDSNFGATEQGFHSMGVDCPRVPSVVKTKIIINDNNTFLTSEPGVILMCPTLGKILAIDMYLKTD